MSASFFTTVVVFLFLVMLLESSSCPGAVYCTAGAFVLGNRGHVSCYFDRDIRDAQHNFNVIRYTSSESDTGTYVLLCNWAGRDNLECKIEDGYSFDYKVKDTLKLNITNITKSSEGLYVCQLVPGVEAKVQTCDLTVQSCPHEDRGSHHSLVSHGVLPNSTQVTQDEESKEELSGTRIVPQIPMYIFIIIGVLSLVVIILCGILIYTVNNRRNSQKTKNYVYDMEQALQAKPQPSASNWSCLACCKTRPSDKPSNEENVENEDLMPSRVTVKYPPNTVHKTTQVFRDYVDKKIQIGNPVTKTEDRETQLGKKDTFPKLMKKNIQLKEPEVIKLGSAERYNNPHYTITHLGKPQIVPLPKIPTARDTEHAYMLVKDAYKHVIKSSENVAVKTSEVASGNAENIQC